MLTSFSVFSDWSGLWVQELDAVVTEMTGEASTAAADGCEIAVRGALIGVGTVSGC